MSVTVNRRTTTESGNQARDELFEQFAPMARRLAGRYHSPHEPLEDLIQVAYVGLLGAIDRFDPDRGIQFRSFAIPTIIGELKRHFRNTGWAAHVPRGAQELALRVDRAAHEIRDRTGRTPGPAELARYLDVDLDDVLVGLDAGTAHFSTSLDAPPSGSGAEEPQPLGEMFGSDDDGYSLVDAKLSLEAAIPRLPHLERVALSLRMRYALKQTEIAERMGCSQMQVSRLLRSAAAHARELTDPSLQSDASVDGSMPASRRRAGSQRRRATRRTGARSSGGRATPAAP
jgi:RNA polymerase sigma-B factor